MRLTSKEQRQLLDLISNLRGLSTSALLIAPRVVKFLDLLPPEKKPLARAFIRNNS